MQDQFFLHVNISKIAMLILEDATSNKEEHVIGDKIVMMTLIGLYLRDSDADLRPVHASITLATQEMATICSLTQFNKFQVRFYKNLLCIQQSRFLLFVNIFRFLLLQ